MNRIIHFLLALSFFGLLSSCSDSGNTVIDDPDLNQTTIDISNPSAWTLASTPADLFPEASLSNNVDYGKNRALLAWYTIDRVFTQSNSPDAPGYIKNDLDGLSYPYVRDVLVSEVYPDRELEYGKSSVIETLNLSFYPRERGPYNLDTNVGQDGYLLDPERRWGGIMHSIDIAKTNFEQTGIKYIQFWMLDPFMDPELGNQDGGYLFFNLGDVSEDVLKDGLMSYEQGLPLNGDYTDVILTVWGKVHAQDEQLNYSTDALRHLQDVGLDGLINQEEFTYPTYANYLNALRNVLSANTYDAMLDDPFLPSMTRQETIMLTIAIPTTIISASQSSAVTSTTTTVTETLSFRVIPPMHSTSRVVQNPMSRISTMITPSTRLSVSSGTASRFVPTRCRWVGTTSQPSRRPMCIRATGRLRWQYGTSSPSL